MKLKGHVTIITGAARGIGAATAVLFAREGAKTVIADVDREGGEKVVAGIVKAGYEALFVHTDVGNESQVERLVQRAVANYTGVHVLVNNAAQLQSTTVASLKLNEWEEILKTNLTGPALCTKHVTGPMRKTGGGAIVNIASIHAICTREKLAAYAASKGGVVALTRNTALELAPYQIRVNAILPGYTLTPLFLSDAKRLGDGEPNRFIAEIERDVPLRRLASPEEIAKVVLFAASHDSSYMTGASLLVDGGISVKL